MFVAQSFDRERDRLYSRLFETVFSRKEGFGMKQGDRKRSRCNRIYNLSTSESTSDATNLEHHEQNWPIFDTQLFSYTCVST